MNWKSFIMVLVAITAAVLAVVLMRDSDPDPVDSPDQPYVGTTGAQPGTDAQPTSDRPTNGVSRRNVGRAPLPSGKPAPRKADERAGLDSSPTDRGDESPAATEGAVGEGGSEVADAGVEEDMRPWKDPVNQRVLGDKRWMAPIDEAEKQRIDDVFEKARAARHDPGLSREDRLTSIDVAEEVVDACFEELDRRKPGIEGRLIVRWTSGATDGQGWISDPEIMVNYRLDDQQFEWCILDALPRQQFPATDAEPVVVEYPFFYDGAF